MSRSKGRTEGPQAPLTWLSTPACSQPLTARTILRASSLPSNPSAQMCVSSTLKSLPQQRVSPQPVCIGLCETNGAGLRLN